MTTTITRLYNSYADAHSAVKALEDAGVASQVFDAGAGSIWPGAIPMRLMVEEKDAWRAKHVLADAERDLEDG